MIHLVCHDTPSLSYHHCDDRLDSVTVMTDTVMSTELLSLQWWQTLYHIGIYIESHIYIGISLLWWQRISYTESHIQLCVQSTELVSSLWWQTLSYMALIRAIYDRVMILSVALCTELTGMIHSVALCTEHRAFIITVMTDSVIYGCYHVSLINEPCLSYPWVMCLLSLCHVSQLHWQQTSLVSFINESCLSYPWVMSLLSSLCIITVMIVSSNHHCDDRLCHCYDRHSDDTPSLSWYP